MQVVAAREMHRPEMTVAVQASFHDLFLLVFGAVFAPLVQRAPERAEFD
jgi:hypothetical protein